jgi:hypothetical protein
MPLVYPGFGWDNLMNKPPGTTVKSRLQGDFLWQQFLDAKVLDATTVYVAMFDEIDESTAIFKVTNDLPVNHYFQTLEGLPSDFYLLLTGYGTRIINGQVEVPASMPDFAAQSQPPVPEILSPGYGDTSGVNTTITWTPVNHTSGIIGYEMELDGQIIAVDSASYSAELSPGTHMLRVRAVNRLNNKGGFSEQVVFTIALNTDVETLRPGMPTGYRMLPNYPNPFNPVTTINFELPQAGQVTIEVYDILGRRTTTLVDEFYAPGAHTVTWDGRDINRNEVSSGVYYIRLQANHFTAVNKALFLK